MYLDLHVIAFIYYIHTLTQELIELQGSSTLAFKINSDTAKGKNTSPTMTRSGTEEGHLAEMRRAQQELEEKDSAIRSLQQKLEDASKKTTPPHLQPLSKKQQREEQKKNKAKQEDFANMIAEVVAKKSKTPVITAAQVEAAAERGSITSAQVEAAVKRANKAMEGKKHPAQPAVAESIDRSALYAREDVHRLAAADVASKQFNLLESVLKKRQSPQPSTHSRKKHSKRSKHKKTGRKRRRSRSRSPSESSDSSSSSSSSSSSDSSSSNNSCRNRGKKYKKSKKSKKYKKKK